MVVYYPTQIDTQLAIANELTPITSALFNDHRSSILAIEETLGLVPQGVYATVKERLNAVDGRMDFLQAEIDDGYNSGGGGSLPGGMPFSVQFNNNNILAGATHVSISSDGYFQLSNDRSSGAATTGDLRTSAGVSFKVKGFDGSDKKIISHINTSLGDEVIYGDGAIPNVELIANNTIGIGIVQPLNPDVSGFTIVGPGAYATGSTSNGIIAYPNFYFASHYAQYVNVGVDPFNGGLGSILIGDIQTLPSANPSNGFYLWSDASSHHPKVQLPNGTIYDLLSISNASGNNNSIQFNNSGSFGGAAHASISSDGYLQIANDRSGGSALTGDLRFPSTSTLTVRNNAGTQDLSVFSVGGFASITNILRIGGRTDGYVGNPSLLFDSVNVVGSTSSILQTIGTPIGHTAQVVAFSSNYQPNSSAVGVHISPNTYFGNNNTANSIVSGNQPFRDAYGVIVVQDAITLTSSPPTGAFDLWSDPGSHHPTVKLPNGNVYDLITANAAGGTTNSVQFNNGSGFGGAGHASISPDGYLQISNDKSGGSALTGDLRLPYFGFISARNSTNTGDIPLLSNAIYNDSGGTHELLLVGRETNAIVDRVGIYSSTFNYLSAYNPNIGGDTNKIIGILTVFGHNAVGTSTNAGIILAPNVILQYGQNGAPNHIIQNNPFRDGYGIMMIGDAYATPSSAPTGAFDLWSNPSNHHPTVHLPNGNTYDLLAGIPSGSAQSVQFNNSGILGGASNIFVSSTGALQLSQLLSPGTPSSNNLYLYADGYNHPKVSLPNGSVYDLTVSAGEYNIMDYGAIADNTTDCAAAIEATIAASGNGQAYPQAGTVYIPQGEFYCARSVNVLRGVNIKGSGYNGYYNGSKINFAPGCGFIFYNTATSAAVGLSGDASGSTIQDLAITSSYMTVNTWQASTHYNLNDVVRVPNDNRYYWICIQAGTSGTVLPFRDDIEGLPLANQGKLLTVEVDEGGCKWICKSHSAIIAFAPIYIYRLYLTNFSNAAIIFFGNLTFNGSDVSGSVCTDIYAYGNGVGIHITGNNDSNAIKLTNSTIIGSGVQYPAETGGFGIADDSFLGCHIFGCDIEASTGRWLYGRPNKYAYGTTTANYVEGSQPESNWRGLVLGGTFGAGLSASTFATGFYSDYWHNINLQLNSAPGAPILRLDEQDQQAFNWHFTGDIVTPGIGERFIGDTSAYKDWFIQSTESSQLALRRITGYSQHRSNQGAHHFRVFNGEFRGDSASPYYVGYNASSITDQAVRAGFNGVGGHFLPGDRIEGTTDGYSSIGQVCTTEGWSAQGSWLAHNQYHIFDEFYRIKPSDTVSPTRPNGLVYACIKTGMSGSSEPIWVTSYLGNGNVPFHWQPGVERQIGECIVPSTRNGHWYKATGLVSYTAPTTLAYPNIYGFGCTGATEPSWSTGAGSTTTDGGIIWTEQGSDAGTYVVDGYTEWQCIGPVALWNNYNDAIRVSATTTTNATGQILTSFALPDNSTTILDVNITGKRSGGHAVSYKLSGSFYRDAGGNATRLGSDDKTFKGVGYSGSQDANLVIDGTSVDVQVNPDENQTWSWSITIQATEGAQ